MATNGYDHGFAVRQHDKTGKNAVRRLGMSAMKDGGQ